METTHLSRKKLTQILRHAILAYECELDNQDYESEEELHRVLLNEFKMTEEEYRKISKRRGGSKLSAYVHVIPDAEYEILQKYLDEGVVGRASPTRSGKRPAKAQLACISTAMTSAARRTCVSTS